MATRVRSSFRKAEHMLKITCDETGSRTHWTLCGRLSGPWVAELRLAWTHARCRFNASSSVVDLTGVTSLDERGEDMLREMQEDGARFVARGVDMKHVLSHLRSKSKPSLRRSLAHLDCSSFEGDKKDS
jgi:hypothetical protein